MKYFLLIAMFLVGNAPAKPIFCHGDDWSMNISNGHDSAILEYQGNGLQFGALSCSEIFPNGHEENRVYDLTCRTSASVADAGYVAALKIDPSIREIVGTLSEVWFGGTRALTELHCFEYIP